MNAPSDKSAILASLPVRPDEDPFAVTIGGFYRRWFNLLDDLQPLIETVKRIEGTEDETWVPAWSAVAQRFERDAEAALASGDRDRARSGFLEAKTYYSLARFPAPYRSGSPICPAEMGPAQKGSLRKLPALLPPRSGVSETPPETVRIARGEHEATGYLRVPSHASASGARTGLCS
jgi:hypothetical protein